jgi:transcriptional regulator with XRE-family HTH domain
MFVLYVIHDRTMPRSTLRTTAAVLRSILEIKDSKMAEVLGCSVSTINSVESGRLRLSAALARKIHYNSGISIGWLMDGDPTAPPVSADGREYTKAIFEEVQARKKYFATSQDFAVARIALGFFRDILAMLVNANRKRNYHLAAYRIGKAIAELRAEFGEAEGLDSWIKALAYVFPLPDGKRIEDVVEFEWQRILTPKSKPPLKKRWQR